MKTFATTLIILLAAAVCGCSPKADDTVALGQYGTAQNYILTGSAEDYQSENDLTFRDSAYIIIPEQIGRNDISALRDSILRMAFGNNASNPLKAARESFGNEARDMGYETEPTDSAITAPDGFRTVAVTVKGLDNRFLTMAIATETYLPESAHGFSEYKYLNYYIPDNQVLTLERIFTPDGLKRLPRLIAERATAGAGTLGPTEIKDLPADDNFYISSGDIFFAYQPYEVASFAQGDINIGFHPYELEDLMTPEGISTFGLGD